MKYPEYTSRSSYPLMNSITAALWWLVAPVSWCLFILISMAPTLVYRLPISSLKNTLNIAKPNTDTSNVLHYLLVGIVNFIITKIPAHPQYYYSSPLQFSYVLSIFLLTHLQSIGFLRISYTQRDV